MNHVSTDIFLLRLPRVADCRGRGAKARGIAVDDRADVDKLTDKATVTASSVGASEHGLSELTLPLSRLRVRAVAGCRRIPKTSLLRRRTGVRAGVRRSQCGVQRLTDFLGRLLSAWTGFHILERLSAA